MVPRTKIFAVMEYECSTCFSRFDCESLSELLDTDECDEIWMDRAKGSGLLLASPLGSECSGVFHMEIACPGHENGENAYNEKDGSCDSLSECCASFTVAVEFHVTDFSVDENDDPDEISESFYHVCKFQPESFISAAAQAEELDFDMVLDGLDALHVIEEENVEEMLNHEQIALEEELGVKQQISIVEAQSRDLSSRFNLIRKEIGDAELLLREQQQDIERQRAELHLQRKELAAERERIQAEHENQRAALARQLQEIEDQRIRLRLEHDQLEAEQQVVEQRKNVVSEGDRRLKNLVGNYLTLGNGTKRPRDVLMEGFRLARRSVSIYIYSFTDSGIFDCLLDCAMRGVRVCVVADFNQTKGSVTQMNGLHRLKENGCVVKTASGRPGLHPGDNHLKTVFIDSKLMCSGSTNFTHRGFFYNAEHLLVTWCEDAEELLKHFDDQLHNVMDLD